MKHYDIDQAIAFIRANVPPQTADKLDEAKCIKALDLLSRVYDEAGIMDLSLEYIDSDDPDTNSIAETATRKSKIDGLTKDDFIAIIEAENQYEDSLIND